MKTFGHCGCCITEQKLTTSRARQGIEYLKYIDSLPEGEKRDRLIEKAYQQAMENRRQREWKLARYGTTNQGKYRNR